MLHLHTYIGIIETKYPHKRIDNLPHFNRRANLELLIIDELSFLDVEDHGMVFVNADKEETDANVTKCHDTVDFTQGIVV